MNRIFIIQFLATVLIMLASLQDPDKSEPKPGNIFEQLFRYQG